MTDSKTSTDAQISKTNGKRTMENRHGLNTTYGGSIAIEKLFVTENVFQDVNEEVTCEPIKRSITEKITKIPIKDVLKEVVAKEVDVEETDAAEADAEENVQAIHNKEEITYNQVKAQTHVDIPIIQPRQEVYHQQFFKNIPRGVELYITQNLQVPKIKPKYVEIQVPIYVPSYVEVPITSSVHTH
ncbi:hypothetical protein, conserved [Plasmodium gonderi]|uniref:Uncharacterized protein n=1 Tax=Plasmodium gonderi TaxID=77519 RepID=A0A1Y1JNX4_PLAGO|nr:hypothetical protein, conserved [Plasmodium gonderi]GAW82927.1 hypothetical protein, conserved [Plasmodium gonderi]